MTTGLTRETEGPRPLRRAVGKPRHFILQGVPALPGEAVAWLHYNHWPGVSVFSWNPHHHSLVNAKVGVQTVGHKEGLVRTFRAGLQGQVGVPQGGGGESLVFLAHLPLRYLLPEAAVFASPAQYRIWGYHDDLKHCFQEYKIEKKAFHPNCK